MTSPTFRFDDPPFPAAPVFPVTAAIDAERARLARATARGIGMPIAGLAFWVLMALLLRALPLRSALFWSYCATGLVLPVGALLTRAAGGDLFARSETLTPLAMLMNATQLFFWPVIFLLGAKAPMWVPYVMATLFGSHFLGYAWMYRSRAYAVLAVGVAVVLSAAALVARDPLPGLMPLLAAGVYGVAVLMLVRERRRER